MNEHERLRELELTVEQLRRENAALRGQLAAERLRHEASMEQIMRSAVEAMSMRPIVIQMDRAALAPQEADRG